VRLGVLLRLLMLRLLLVLGMRLGVRLLLRLGMRLGVRLVRLGVRLLRLVRLGVRLLCSNHPFGGIYDIDGYVYSFFVVVYEGIASFVLFFVISLNVFC
jgi:hypothetical protein